LREAIGLCSRTGYDVVLLGRFDPYAWLCAATAYWARCHHEVGSVHLRSAISVMAHAFLR
jgi:hypothetical protein